MPFILAQTNNSWKIDKVLRIKSKIQFLKNVLEYVSFDNDSVSILLCLRNSKIVNFLGSVLFFEPTPKVLESKQNKQQRK